MNSQPSRRLRPGVRTVTAAAGLTAVLVLAGCSQGQTAGNQTKEPGAANSAAALPSQHVHGIARDPGTDTINLATHDGLFTLGKNGSWRPRGQPIDLMGFAVDADGEFYASGHPDPSTGIPEPAGLLSSKDSGKTWIALSRGGESDFHALTASTRGVIGFDGQLRYSSDGRSWREGAMSAPPRSLAASPSGSRVLATTEKGLLASDNHGRTWTAVNDAPLLLLVAWADNKTAVGVTPAGDVVFSADAGDTWQQSTAQLTDPLALTASRTTGGGLEMLAATATGVVTSDDWGKTFEPATA